MGPCMCSAVGAAVVSIDGMSSSYLIHEVIPGGAYRLRNPKTGVDEKNPWNAAQLCHFYP
jgi:hypothetical protein